MQLVWLPFREALCIDLRSCASHRQTTNSFTKHPQCMPLSSLRPLHYRGFARAASFQAKLRALQSELQTSESNFAMSLPRDVQAFLDGYPGQSDNGQRDNLRFYLGTLKCRPDNLLIDDLHQRWQGRYNILESRHGFIQWLFPIREFGMNSESQPLQPGEISEMKQDAKVRERLVKSYRLILDFVRPFLTRLTADQQQFGMQLKDEETGELARADSWEPQYDNLSTSSHNYLRISRILKCLGELGFEHYPVRSVFAS
jgi:hypothetical protein